MTEILGKLPERWQGFSFDQFGKPKRREKLTYEDQSDEDESDECDLPCAINWISDEYHGPWRHEDDAQHLKISNT
jgi:hypothetical protein